ncbi:MAG: GNAT family N-acetyltransferase [Gammaproteobacteria bacterium]|nr:GNAT family N-acetyltransferase [Gammaproteobacteria bacterium]
MRTSRLVNARPRTGICAAGELPALIAALDAEFVTGRGRNGSLAWRYPDLLNEQNLPQIHVRRHGGRIVSCCAARRFTWTGTRERWQGAMLGLVWTAPHARGRGHAAEILDAASDALTAAGVDFLVLWSGLEGFYERLGWDAHDRGVFGSLRITDPTQRRAPALPDAIDVARYEALRAPEAKARVTRDAQRYRCIPLPALRVGTVFVRDDDAEAAAIVGATDDAYYVYEVVGAPAALGALWQSLTAGAPLIHVNESIGSPFHRWLAQHTSIAFTAQELAHWRMLSPRARRTTWRDWHIPYFDRI